MADSSVDTVVPQGPFGGPGGDDFYDGVGDIVQISVTYSDANVWSVQTNYRQSATNFSAAQHGSNGPKRDMIVLDFPDEYFVQVRGTTDPAGGLSYDVVTSLTFITNRKTYGPYGAVVGRKFQSSPLGKVVGFFGKSGRYIDKFGIFTEFFNVSKDLSAQGPWGGNGGGVFYDGRADRIKEIDVESDEQAIISLNVHYDQCNQGFLSSKHGGGGQAHGTIEKIVFADDEYLAWVAGTTGTAYGNLTLVTGLYLISNKTVYGPYGPVSGNWFSSDPNCQVLGFYGRSGWMLDQLGAFVTAGPPAPVLVDQPWGEKEETPFYEGRGELSQIVVTYSPNDMICKLQVTYLQGDEPFDAPTHGTGDGETATITLNYPDEYLVEVVGTHGPAHNVKDMILSLQFITNLRKYGPYGNPSAGFAFTSSYRGHVVGFFGRSGGLLDQIGIIVAPSEYHGSEVGANSAAVALPAKLRQLIAAKVPPSTKIGNQTGATVASFAKTGK